MSNDKPKQFVINRSQWRFGGSDADLIYAFGDTRLLNVKGYQCWLGFVALQCGTPVASMPGMGMPVGLIRSVPDHVLQNLDGVLVDLNSRSNSRLAELAEDINDDKSYASQQEREQDLIQLFYQHGFILMFEGEYTDEQKTHIAQLVEAARQLKLKANSD